MATPQRPGDRDDLALTIASTYDIVNYKNLLYLPTDYETEDFSTTPPPERRVWKVLDTRLVERLAKAHGLLFRDDKEAHVFRNIIRQSVAEQEVDVSELLIGSPDGLLVLTTAGDLIPATGEFIPNYLPVWINTDAAVKAKVMDTFIDWVGGSEEEALSLLHHLATTLAPHWSAVKYVLLIGHGRNGKSVLMKMLAKIFGADNCSHVTRQQISEGKSEILALQNKLLNMVFDGQKGYLKDSGNEKALVAGDPITVRPLYSSSHVELSTNALFIEGLNEEPRSSDKSSALQERLIRYIFPNTYGLDPQFARWATSDAVVGALLSLLVDNYVTEDNVQVMLAPTAESQAARLDHVVRNSSTLQFILHVEDNCGGADTLIGMDSRDAVDMYIAWRVRLGDIGTYTPVEVGHKLREVLVLGSRRSMRVNNQIVKSRPIEGFRLEALKVLEEHRKVEVVDDTVVDD